MGELAVIERARADNPYDGKKPMARKCNGHHSDGSGDPCESPIPMANGKCRAHGGATPKGIASATLKTGKWSKDLPVRLQANALASFADPDQLSQRKALAILEARFWDVMASSSNQESGELWEALHNAKQRYYKATGKDADKTRAEALAEVWFLIIEGYNERQSWREMRDIIQEMRLLRESEQKSLVNKQQSISASEAMVMLGAVLHIIKSNVTDKDALARISREVAALVNKPDHG